MIKRGEHLRIPDEWNNKKIHISREKKFRMWLFGIQRQKQKLHQEDSTARVRIHKRQLNTFFYSILVFFLSFFFVISLCLAIRMQRKSEAKRMNERDVNTWNRRELRRRKNTTTKWRINQHTNKTVRSSEEITHHTAAPATMYGNTTRAPILQTRLDENYEVGGIRECKRIDKRNKPALDDDDDDDDEIVPFFVGCLAKTESNLENSNFCICVLCISSISVRTLGAACVHFPYNA